MTTEPALLLLVDTAWQPTPDAPGPPVTATIGAWHVRPDGTRGWFQPNPAYRPSTPGSPLDPVDAALGLLARGEFDADQLSGVLRDVMFGVALDEQGRAIVRLAPDGVPSVFVTTSYGHRDRVDAAGWRNVTLAELASALPSHGVDVLLNPGAPTSMRLAGAFLRG